MYSYIRKAKYHETDQMGIIHHANYIKWMEEARIAMLDQLGFPYR
ncbi:acyl-CoA thioesterase, partial [[Ruminococcus] torques]